MAEQDKNIVVMARLGRAIHEFFAGIEPRFSVRKTWMAGTSPAMTVKCVAGVGRP